MPMSSCSHWDATSLLKFFKSLFDSRMLSIQNTGLSPDIKITPFYTNHFCWWQLKDGIWQANSSWDYHWTIWIRFWTIWLKKMLKVNINPCGISCVFVWIKVQYEYTKESENDSAKIYQKKYPKYGILAAIQINKYIYIYI